MSEVKVNKISPRSGTTVTLGDSGDTFTVPSGATFDASNATTTLPSTVVTTTGSQTLTNKTIDASQLTGTITPSDATVTPAKLAYNYNQYRNIIINGDMSIAQRGTSVSSISTTQYGSLDRFQMLTQTAGSAVFTMSQDTDVPSGQGFAKSQKIDVTTALDPYASNNFTNLRYMMEGQMLQYLKKGTANAESLTLSFWVKSNKTGTYIAELFDADNSRQISKSYTIDSASTWEKKTITFAGDTTGTLDNDNARSLDLRFWLAGGTDYTSGTLNTSWNSSTNTNRAVGQVNFADSTSNDFWITGVQLEAGTIASDFEFLPVDVNLARCQRYFYINPNSSGGAGFIYTAHPMFNIQLPVTMRANPSCTVSGGSAITSTNAYGQVTYTSPTSTSFNTRTKSVRLLYAGGTWNSSITYGLGIIGYPTDLLISAEL